MLEIVDHALSLSLSLPLPLFAVSIQGGMQQFCEAYAEHCRDRDVPAHAQVLYAASTLATSSSADFVVDGVTLGARGCDALSCSIHLLPPLKVLSLRDCYLGDEGLCKLAQAVINSSHCRSLCRVSLAGNGLHGDASSLMLGLLATASPNLEELNLEWNRLGLCLAAHFPSSGDMMSFNHISASPSSSRGSSIRGLVGAVVTHQTLRVVNMSNNQLGGFTVGNEICDMLHRAASLEAVDLSWNNLGPMLPAIAEALVLRRVDVYPHGLHRVVLHGNGAHDPVALAVVEAHLQRVALHRSRCHIDEMERRCEQSEVLRYVQGVTAAERDALLDLRNEKASSRMAMLEHGAWKLALEEEVMRRELVEDALSSAFRMLVATVAELRQSRAHERTLKLGGSAVCSSAPSSSRESVASDAAPNIAARDVSAVEEPAVNTSSVSDSEYEANDE